MSRPSLQKGRKAHTHTVTNIVSRARIYGRVGREKRRTQIEQVSASLEEEVELFVCRVSVPSRTLLLLQPLV